MSESEDGGSQLLWSIPSRAHRLETCVGGGRESRCRDVAMLSSTWILCSWKVQTPHHFMFREKVYCKEPPVFKRLGWDWWITPLFTDSKASPSTFPLCLIKGQLNPLSPLTSLNKISLTCLGQILLRLLSLSRQSPELWPTCIRIQNSPSLVNFPKISWQQTFSDQLSNHTPSHLIVSF